MNNLVSLELVSLSYGVRPLLSQVSLGVLAGERIGVVGRNGDGKTTLLRLLAGLAAPDDGRVAANRGLRVGFLPQVDPLLDRSVREVVLGDRADHEWAAERDSREIVEILLAGVDLERRVAGLSGGERRRCSLARLLLGDHELLLLDEPTNHLDVEGVAWLAGHLDRRTCAQVVVTHDRWFLDAVCTTTWEVHDASVDVYDGGYAAFVLAKAERARQAAAEQTRRQNLVRKELAWLRRGAPARTSKPKFRLDAATALIEDEPPPRDRLELQRFAAARLGKDVLDLEDVDVSLGERSLLRRATWRLGPGERVGLVGVNGAGKTSVLRLLDGSLRPDTGRVRHGRTVQLEHLTQSLDSLDPRQRVLACVESIRRVSRVDDGRDVTATAMLERFGFTGDRLTARIGDLSGGERRRLQLLRLLLSGPNVLLLDEPTNDLDIETLNVLEDFLDGWPGTLVVVSHDRYFLERVTDTVWALLDDGLVSMLPGGVEEYLARRADSFDRHGSVRGRPRRTSLAPSSLGGQAQPASGPPPDKAALGGATAAGAGEGAASGLRQSSRRTPSRAGAGAGEGAASGLRQSSRRTPSRSGEGDAASGAGEVGAAEERAAKKTIARIDKQLARVAQQAEQLHAAMGEAASDYERLAELGARLEEVAAVRERLEDEWLAAATVLD